MSKHDAHDEVVNLAKYEFHLRNHPEELFRVNLSATRELSNGGFSVALERLRDGSWEKWDHVSLSELRKQVTKKTSRMGRYALDAEEKWRHIVAITKGQGAKLIKKKGKSPVKKGMKKGRYHPAETLGMYDASVGRKFSSGFRGPKR